MTPKAASFLRCALLALALQASVTDARKFFQKIIGGSYAVEGEFPYQLSMETSSYGMYYGFCGASAISDFWALSAAHCVVEGTDLIATDDTFLRSGSLTKAHGGMLHPVEKIIAHYKYTTERYDCDVAVLKVTVPFSNNPAVSYVRLPRQGRQLPVGTKVVTIGWGLTNSHESSEELKKTLIEVVDDRVCANIPHFRQAFQITKDMICAIAEGTDSAPGDSGGPLVITEAPSHVQVGVVSWGTGTGQLSDPGVYTKLSEYRVWIHSKTGV